MTDDNINKWDGATDAGSEWAELRRQGHSHREAVDIIEGKDNLKSVTNYFADHDLSDINILETAIEIDEVDMDMIIIDIFVYFPFPDVAGVDVVAHEGLNDVVLIEVKPENNLGHYARRMGDYQGAF